MSTFQYQAISEPLLVSAPVATVYLDWQAQSSWRPQRRSRSVAVTSQPVVPFISAITLPPRVRRKFSFAHDESIQSKNSRLHEQQVAKFLNQLLLSGELQGTPIDPSLGYQCDDPAAWNTVSPSSLKEAIDRIAAALKTLMGGIP